jgi:hypothetical protein
MEIGTFLSGVVDVARRRSSMKIFGRLRKTLKCSHCPPHRGHNRKKTRKHKCRKDK